MISDQTARRRRGAGVCDQATAHGRTRHTIRTKEKVSAYRIALHGRERDAFILDVVHARTWQHKIDVDVVSFDLGGHRFRAVEHAVQRRARVRGCVRDGGNVRPIKRILYEGRTIPSVEFERWMQFKMSLVPVLGVETEDAAKNCLMPGKRAESS